MSLTTTFTETVGQFKKRKGSLRANDTGRLTSETVRTSGVHETKKHNGHGYIRYVGKVIIPKNATTESVQHLISKASHGTQIVEYYPTHYCSNCQRSCWQFVTSEHRGHATCRGCGVVQNIAKNGIKLYLGEDGTASKSQWEITPGMTADDCSIKNKRGNTRGNGEYGRISAPPPPMGPKKGSSGWGGTRLAGCDSVKIMQSQGFPQAEKKRSQTEVEL